MIKSAQKWKEVSFFLVFILVAFFIFWKCSFGFGNADESFVLTIPFRLTQGDGLFSQEWHLSQMAGFLTYPFVSLFLKIKGNTDGIILTFRYLYSFVTCLVSIYAYQRLKKMNWIGAATAAISILLYAPYNIMTLSYNTLGIMSLIVSLTTIMSAQKNCRVQYVIAGVFYAFAVLCCQFLAVVYIGYLIFVLLKRASKNRGTFDYKLFNTTCAGYLTLGALLTAVVFLVFVFSRTSFSQILDSISWILNDPEHKISLLYKFVLYFRAVLMPNVSTPFVYLLFIGLFIFYLCDKQRRGNRYYYFIAATFITLLLFASHYFGNNYINDMMWPLNMLALVVFILTDNRKIKSVFYTLWLPGMLYGFCINISSNQTYHAIFSASSVATVGSILMVGMFLNEINTETKVVFLKKTCSVLVILSFVVQIMTVGILRYNGVFGETGIRSQTELIQSGSQAGLRVSAELYSEYCIANEEINSLAKYEPQKVLFLSKKAWLYFIDDYEIAAFSAWLSGVNTYTVEKLLAYYELNPDKKPDVVYAEIQHEEFLEQLGQALGMNKVSTPYGIALIK